MFFPFANCSHYIDRYISYTFALILCFISLNADASEAHFLTRQEMKKELSLTYKLLRTYHPNVYLYRSRKQLDAIFRDIEDDIKNQNKMANAYTLIARMLGAVCDHHTYISPISSSSAIAELKHVWNPAQQDFDFREGKLFAKLANGLGSHELIKINGIEAESLQNILLQTTPRDGCAAPLSHGVEILAPHTLLPFSAVTGDEVKVKASYRHADLDSVMPAIAGRVDLMRALSISRRIARSINKQRDAILSENGYEAYDFANIDENSRFSRSLNPGKIDFRYSSEKRSAYVRLNELPGFNETEIYIHRIFRAIIKTDPANLILDLSQSPGGSIKTASLITAYLVPKAHRLATHVKVRNLSRKTPENFHLEDKQFAKTRLDLFRHLKRLGRRNGIYKTALARTSFGLPHYKGKLYILVGPETASAATLVAKYLQRERNAIVIGSPSLASARNYCAQAPGDFELPYSKLRLQIPRECFFNSETLRKNGGRINPDIKIDGYPQILSHRITKIYRDGLRAVAEQSVTEKETTR